MQAEPASLDVVWNHGAVGEPLIQVHTCAVHTAILRQSKRTSYEAPFLFLLFGTDRALLLDTGATADAAQFPLRATVDRLIDEWLRHHPREGYELVVAHTHGHGDHVAADEQFADRLRTTVVARDADAVSAYFGLSGGGWAAFDLGDRTLEVTASPGHHRAAITVYDPWTGMLFTGDTILPGRLYVEDPAAFRSTMDRLVEFAAARPVTHILGCHIEMKARPGKDFPIFATFQPGERPLQLGPAHLTEIRDAAYAAGDKPGVHRYADFILYNRPGQLALLRLVARGKLNGLLRRFAQR